VAVVLVPEGIASLQGSMLALPIVLAVGLLFFVSIPPRSARSCCSRRAASST